LADEIRFGVVSESVPRGRAWLEHARRIEGAGVSALLLRDHFSAGAFGPQLAPFSARAGRGCSSAAAGRGCCASRPGTRTRWGSCPHPDPGHRRAL